MKVNLAWELATVAMYHHATADMCASACDDLVTLTFNAYLTTLLVEEIATSK